MNKIRVNHHEMNYIGALGFLLLFHMLFGMAVVAGSCKLGEGVAGSLIFLIGGLAVIIIFMMLLDKSEALVTWDEKQIRVRFRGRTEVIAVGEIEELSCTLYREYYGRYGSSQRISVNIKADGREYSISDVFGDDMIPVLINGCSSDVPILKLYNSLKEMRPGTDMGFVKSEKRGLL